MACAAAACLVNVTHEALAHTLTENMANQWLAQRKFSQRRPPVAIVTGFKHQDQKRLCRRCR